MAITFDAADLTPDAAGIIPATVWLSKLGSYHTELGRILGRVLNDRIEDGSSLTAGQRASLRARANALVVLIETLTATRPPG